MRRRSLLVALVAFAACGDPYGGEGTGALPDSDAGTDAGTEAAVDASAPESGDSGAPLDPCDRDGDGFRDRSATCGGDDCDDEDKRAHPDAGFSGAEPTPKTNGDWNCSDVVERPSPTKIGCEWNTLTASCRYAEGFSGLPGCGLPGQYIHCSSNGAGSCTVSQTETRIAQCR